MININTQFLNELKIFCSKDDFRPYLKYVHIFDRDNKRIYEATNGHYLARIISDKPEGESAVDIGIKFKNKFKGKAGTLDGCTLKTDKESVEVEILDGAFPDCDKILNDFNGAKPVEKYICFNPDYLKRVADFFGRDWYGLQPPKQQDFSAWGGDPNSQACFWQLPDESRIVALMPVRIRS